MGLCVRELVTHRAMAPGDVVVTNHPAYGGSHLPDVTAGRGICPPVGNHLPVTSPTAPTTPSWAASARGRAADARRLIEEGVVYLRRCPCRVSNLGGSAWKSY